MRLLFYVSLLVFTFAISSYAQNDWHTYPVRSVADIIKAHSGEASERGDIIISADPFPSKTKVTYTGKSRSISKYTKDFIGLWVQTRNVLAENANMLVEEYLFKEQDKEYWIPIIKSLTPLFAKELKEGDEITVYYFFLGGYNEKKLMEKDTSLKPEKSKELPKITDKDKPSEQDKGKIEWIFALEKFQK